MSNQYNPLDDVPWQIRTQNLLQSSPAFSVVTDSLSPERFPQSQVLTNLGITLHERLGWTQHIDELLCRGERKLAACVSWTQSATLPLFFVERIFHSYVRPSACFGLEFVPKGAQIRRFQARLIKWGRRLLTWPHGSPRVAVQGQLGWHDADTLRLSHAAGLCARLLCLPPHCFAAA